jgi:hypothetical protein
LGRAELAPELAPGYFSILSRPPGGGFSADAPLPQMEQVEQVAHHFAHRVTLAFLRSTAQKAGKLSNARRRDSAGKYQKDAISRFSNRRLQPLGHVSVTQASAYHIRARLINRLLARLGVACMSGAEQASKSP